MTHKLIDSPAEAAMTAAQMVQDLAAAQLLFCESLMNGPLALAASLNTHSTHPDENERPSVSARNQDWVAG